MTFDTDFGDGGFKSSKPLEPELQRFSDDLVWCNHVVLFAPMWWGGLPAKLKGLFDRVLLPGYAFNTREKTIAGLPKPMLEGRTGRVVFTSDTPGFFFRMVYRQALVHQTRGQIMHFIGVKPTKVTWLSGATDASRKKIKRWSSDITRLGRAAA